MMRHQNARVTLEAYTDAVTDKKRMAQSRIVASILPRDAKAPIVPVGALTSFFSDLQETDGSLKLLKVRTGCS